MASISISTHSDTEAILSDTLDFETIGRVLIDKALVTFQYVVLIFLASMLLTLFFPSLSVSRFLIILCSCIIDIVLIWYLRKRLIHRHPHMAAQIFILSTLVLGLIVGINTYSPTLMLAVAVAMSIIVLPLKNIRFTILMGSISIGFYWLTLSSVRNQSGTTDIFLNLPSPIGPFMNILLACLCFFCDCDGYHTLRALATPIDHPG